MTTVHPRSSGLAILVVWMLLCPAFGSWGFAVDPGGTPPGLDSVPAAITGKVLLPGGKPAANAPVLLFWHRPIAQTQTRTDGSFTMPLDTEQIKQQTGDDWPRVALSSALPGIGPAWVVLGKIENASAVTLQMVEDQPVSGRILDQQGRPVEGANVTIISMHRAQNENLDGFLQAGRDDPTRTWLYERDSMIYLSPEALLKMRGVNDQGSPTASTDASGQFTFTGFGKERVLYASVAGPGIARETFYIATRPEIDARWKRGQPSRETLLMLESGATMPSIYAAHFHHLAAPALLVQGRLTDAVTGNPVVGMNLIAGMRGSTSYGTAVSDENGRYQIGGLPLGNELRISALNPGDKPYLDAKLELAITSTKQIEPIDFQLDRGTRISGRVVDKRTGAGVAGNIGYLTWPNNESLRTLHQPYDTFNTMGTDVEGNYSIVVPMGPGVLTFTARDRSRFDVAEDFGFPVRSDGMFASGNHGLVKAQHFHFLQRIEPTVGDETLKIDITIGQGDMLRVHVRDSEGREIGEIEARGLMSNTLSGFRTGNFSIPVLNPEEKRTLFLRNREREYAAVFQIEGKETSTLEVLELTLERSATVSGRITDQMGRPLSRWFVAAVSDGMVARRSQAKTGVRQNDEFEFDHSISDADGYFRLKGLPAGTPIEIATAQMDDDRPIAPILVTNITLRPGRQQDLGQLTVVDRSR